MNEELPEKISGGSDDPDICDLSPLKRHEWEAQIPLSPPSKKPLLSVKTREVSSVMSITMTMELAAAAVSLWKRHMLICLRDAVQDPRQQIEGFRDRPQIKHFNSLIAHTILKMYFIRKRTLRNLSASGIMRRFPAQASLFPRSTGRWTARCLDPYGVSECNCAGSDRFPCETGLRDKPGPGRRIRRFPPAAVFHADVPRQNKAPSIRSELCFSKKSLGAGRIRLIFPTAQSLSFPRRGQNRCCGSRDKRRPHPAR